MNMQEAVDPIRVEQTYPQTPAAVWEAITEVEKMRAWYFPNIPAFKAEPGFKTEFPVECGGRTFLHRWTVTEAVPPKKLVYNWRYGGHPGDSFVTFDLMEAGEGTRLTLTHRMVEAFPGNIPEFSRKSCSEGWAYLIRKSLKAFLEHPA